MPNKLTVIIPSRKRSNLIPCLDALVRNELDVDIVVVDDGLEDHSCLEDCVVVPGVKPFVFARNINVGIRAAGDSDVILLNDDALLGTKAGFSLMQRLADNNPEFGIISPGVKGPSNSPEHRPRGISQVLREARGFTVPFIAVFVPRRAIQSIGLLDERFDCYGGEDEYCYRVRKAGLKIAIFDGCVVDHGTLQSTFRPDGKGLPITEAQRIFREIHGFEMATR